MPLTWTRAIRPMLLFVCCSILLSCVENRPEPQALRLEVGVHTLTLLQPDGWNHLDQGSQQRFRNGSTKILITDAGAVTHLGYLQQLNAVLDLVDMDQPKTASAELRQIRIGREQFPSDASHRDYLAAQRAAEKVLLKPYGADRAELDIAFDALRQSLDPAGRKRLEQLVPDQLRPFGFDEMRSIAHREYRTIQSHPVLIVDTWDRMSHQHPRRYALALNRGALLVLYNETGYDKVGVDQVSALMDSLRFSEVLRPDAAS